MPDIPAPSPADLARDLTADYTSMQRPLRWNEIDLDAWDDAREGWPAAIRRAVAAERRAEALREALEELLMLVDLGSEGEEDYEPAPARKARALLRGTPDA